MKMPKVEDEEDDRVQVAPNMGAGGSHPQATSVPEEEEAEEKEEEEEKEAGEGQQRKGEWQSLTGQWILTSAREWRSESSHVGKWADCVDEETEEGGEEEKQEAENECEGVKAEEQRRGAEQVDS